jgi:hypothetical protein
MISQMIEKWTCRRDLIHREFISLDDNARCLLWIERLWVGEDSLGGDRGRFEQVRVDVPMLCGFSLIGSEEEADENDWFASVDGL